MPVRDAAREVRRGQLDWLRGCPQPIVFGLAPDDPETAAALGEWIAATGVDAEAVVQTQPRLSGAVNATLGAVRTRYAHWCGVDDRIYWERYPEVAEILAGRVPPLWMIGRGRTLRPDGRATLTGTYKRLLHPFMRRILPLSNIALCQSIIFSAAGALSLGGFDVDNVPAPDYDMWIRLLKQEPPLLVPVELGVFTIHNGSLTKGYRRQAAELCYRTRRDYFGNDWLPTLAKWLQVGQGRLQDLIGE
jgi:hypothetical protein